VTVRRRTLLGTGAAALALAVAGCSESASGSSGDGGDGSPRVYNVNAATPVTENREFATTLRVEWHYRSQSVVDPDEAPERPAPDEVQFLVCQFRVINVGDVVTPVAPAMFQLAAPSTENVFTRLSFDDPDYFPDRELDPDDVANGWVAFHAPQLQDEMVLALDQETFPEPVDAEFERTDSLEFTLNDDDTGTTAPGEPTPTTEVA
jgi:hypothetical protein